MLVTGATGFIGGELVRALLGRGHVVRVLVRGAEPARDGCRIPGTLRSVAAEAGVTLLEAHRALQQLIDRKVIRLVDDVLMASDVERLSACLDAPS